MTVSLVEICSTLARWLTQHPQNPDWSADTWERVKVACRVHGLAAKMWQRLSGQPWIEPDMADWFHTQYRFNRERIARITADTGRILNEFNRCNLPVMPLKGVILNEFYYDDPATRPMSDIDLLVPVARFGEASRLLSQLGYEPEAEHRKHAVYVQSANRRVISRNTEHPENPRRVELHPACRENFGGPAVDLTTTIWQHARLGRVAGQAAYLPQPENLWLHLLVHSSYHLWQGRARLVHLLDLWLVWQTEAPGNTMALAEAVSKVDGRYTYPALALLGRHFGDTPLAALIKQQQTGLSPRFRHWVESLDLVNSSYLNSDPPGTYLGKALSFSEGRPEEVFQALRCAFLPGLDELSLDHPRLARSKVPWLAYLLLPLDWSRRIGGRR